MKKLEIGKSGIEVPYIGMGTWAIGGGLWWGNIDDALSVKAIEEAIDSGIQLIDTAPVYGVGHSEEVVGRAIKEKRDKVILSTKCGLQWNHESPYFHKEIEGKQIYRDLSGESIRKDLEDSLKRINTDYIDIYYTHWQAPSFDIYPLEETMETLLSLKKEGKIRAIGASNVNADIIKAYCSLGQLDIIQEKYSILDTRIKEDLIPVCLEYGVSVQAYSPLEQGLLTGKVTKDTVLSATDVRNNNRFWKSGTREKVLDMLDQMKIYAEKYNCSICNLITAYTAATIPGLHVLCGARKPEQVEENIKALDVHLFAEDVAEIGTLVVKAE